MGHTLPIWLRYQRLRGCLDRVVFHDKPGMENFVTRFYGATFCDHLPNGLFPRAK